MEQEIGVGGEPPPLPTVAATMAATIAVAVLDSLGLPPVGRPSVRPVIKIGFGFLYFGSPGAAASSTSTVAEQGCAFLKHSTP